jgi:hypothetical protein
MPLRYTIDAASATVEIYLIDRIDGRDTDPIEVGHFAAADAARIAEQAVRQILSTPGTSTNRSRPDEPPRLQTGAGRNSIDSEPTRTGFRLLFRDTPAARYMAYHQMSDREFFRRAIEGKYADIERSLRAGIA